MNSTIDCRDCEYYNSDYMRCKKYNEPVPCNIELKLLRCESCRKGVDVNESKDNS